MIKKSILFKKGFFLASTLVFAGISVLLITAVVSGASSVLKLSRSVYDRELAFQIAEAGIEYYRWHLAHDQDDFQDGTAGPGPYNHIFYDKTANRIGTFSLTITPPSVGSTIVTVQSDGRVDANPGVVRKIKVRLAIPSLAKYAVAANDTMRFGEGTEVFGPIHSNGGIRFDGLAHNLVTSALTSYDDPDHAGNQEYGVHTHLINPAGSGVSAGGLVSEDPPPATPPNRPDVFMAGRTVGVPALNFGGIITDLATMKALGQSASGRYYASSGALGYEIVLKTNDTYDLYRVTAFQAAPNGCVNELAQDGWGTWSIRTVNGKVLISANNAFPANGIIFVEDNLWVRGQINTARLSIASGRFPDNPATRTSITVNENLLYTNYDGSDVIGLIAQNNINAGMLSADTYRIDAALIAQNGRVGRYYYRPPGGGNRCSPYHARTSITLYGMIASNIRYGFGYTDGTGYDVRNIIYDGSLLYGPPPSFPLTSDQYQVISWEEVI